LLSGHSLILSCNRPERARKLNRNRALKQSDILKQNVALKLSLRALGIQSFLTAFRNIKKIAARATNFPPLTGNRCAREMPHSLM
jgi:hypothetical protein